MRLLSAFAALALASCAGVGGAGSSSAGSVRSLSLSPDLFPLVPRTQRFAMTRGEPRTLRIEAAGPDAATLWLEGGRTPQRMDVTVTAVGMRLRGDPDSETELLRFGAEPGTQWRSGATAVRFAGWERVEVAAGQFDAARVETTLPDQSLRQDETWWFAPGVGIVKLRSDYGGLFQEEMSLSAR